MNKVSYQLSLSVKAHIDHWVAKFPAEHVRSAIVSALLYVQEDNGGYLTQASMEAVADYLNQPSIYVFELATFYDMFELHPIGQFKISVCTNLSCQLMGSQAIVDRLKKRLGIDLGDTSSDGKFTLREVECLAACGYGPVCQVNDKDYHERLTPEKMDALIDQLSGESDDT